MGPPGLCSLWNTKPGPALSYQRAMMMIWMHLSTDTFAFTLYCQGASKSLSFIAS